MNFYYLEIVTNNLGVKAQVVENIKIHIIGFRKQI